MIGAMKEYRVWIEIEEYDPATEKFRDITSETRIDNFSCAFGPTTDLEEAEAVAVDLQHEGESCVPESAPQDDE
jgi:hypothetical protein